MTPASLVMAALVSATVAGALDFRPEVELTSRDIRLGDVADLAGVPVALQPAARTLVVGRVPRDRTDIVLSVSRLSARVRALAPALSPYLPAAPSGGIHIRLASSLGSGDEPPVLGCMRVNRRVPAGAAIGPEDVAPSACGVRPRAGSVAYRPALGLGLAVRDLEPGEEIRAIPQDTLAAVKAGDALTVTARVGPVTVERRARALRPAQPGKPVLVAGEDGQVFQAPPLQGGPTP